MIQKKSSRQALKTRENRTSPRHTALKLRGKTNNEGKNINILHFLVDFIVEKSYNYNGITCSRSPDMLFGAKDREPSLS